MKHCFNVKASELKSGMIVDAGNSLALYEVAFLELGCPCKLVSIPGGMIFDIDVVKPYRIVGKGEYKRWLRYCDSVQYQKDWDDLYPSIEESRKTQCQFGVGIEELKDGMVIDVGCSDYRHVSVESEDEHGRPTRLSFNFYLEQGPFASVIINHNTGALYSESDTFSWESRFRVVGQEELKAFENRSFRYVREYDVELKSWKMSFYEQNEGVEGFAEGLEDTPLVDAAIGDGPLCVPIDEVLNPRPGCRGL